MRYAVSHEVYVNKKTPNILFGDDARMALTTGARVAAATIGSTLGPGGRTVLVDRPWRPPLATKDGVTVAREVDLEHRHAHMGAMFVREAARKTVEEAGDGTTTASILCGDLLRRAQKLCAAGIDPMALARGMRASSQRVATWLTHLVRDVDSTEDIERVALLASNEDQVIASAIAEAMEAVGQYGVINIGRGHQTGIEVDVSSGAWFDRGWATYSLLNPDEHAAQRVVINRPLILLLGDPLLSAHGAVALMEAALRTIKQWNAQKAEGAVVVKSYGGLLIVGDVQGDALSTVVQNSRAGQLKVCVVRPPWTAGTGTGKLEALEDLAVATGAGVLSCMLGRPVLTELSEAAVAQGLSVLGVARLATVTKERTVLDLPDCDLEGCPLKPRREHRRAKLEQQLDRMVTEGRGHSADRVRIRMSRLGGGIATLKVGGLTETEAAERSFRTEDALCAARAAVEHGILPGGGAALLRCAAALRVMRRDPCYCTQLTKDERVGFDLAVDALETPFRVLVRNVCGRPGRADVLAAQLMELDDNMVWNVHTEQFVDAWESGLFDPAAVVTHAWRSAISTASSALEVEVSIHPLRPR